MYKLFIFAAVLGLTAAKPGIFAPLTYTSPLALTAPTVPIAAPAVPIAAPAVPIAPPLRFAAPALSPISTSVVAPLGYTDYAAPYAYNYGFDTYYWKKR